MSAGDRPDTAGSGGPSASPLCADSCTSSREGKASPPFTPPWPPVHGPCLVAHRKKHPGSFLMQIPTVISLECVAWLRLSPSTNPSLETELRRISDRVLEMASQEPAKSCSDGGGDNDSAGPESETPSRSPLQSTLSSQARGPQSPPFLLVLGSWTLKALYKKGQAGRKQHPRQAVPYSVGKASHPHASPFLLILVLRAYLGQRR